jgi:hypothetical protein
MRWPEREIVYDGEPAPHAESTSAYEHGLARR